MNVVTPIREEDIEFDHGSFDAAAFARQTLASCSPAAVIDHTLLKPEATASRSKVSATRLSVPRCAWSTRYGPLPRQRALRHRIPVGATIGFPLGASLASTLRQEAAALALGRARLDMVIPIGYLKSGNRQAVEHTIHAAATVAHHHGALLKVILRPPCLPWRKNCAARKSPSRPARTSSRLLPAFPPEAPPLPTLPCCAA